MHPTPLAQHPLGMLFPCTSSPGLQGLRRAPLPPPIPGTAPPPAAAAGGRVGHLQPPPASLAPSSSSCTVHEDGCSEPPPGPAWSPPPSFCILGTPQCNPRGAEQGKDEGSLATPSLGDAFGGAHAGLLGSKPLLLQWCLTPGIGGCQLQHQRELEP